MKSNTFGFYITLINYYNGFADNLQSDINNWVVNMGFSDEKQLETESSQ